MRRESAVDAAGPLRGAAASRFIRSGRRAIASRAMRALRPPILALSAALLTMACGVASSVPPSAGPAALEYRAGLNLSGGAGIGGLSGLYVSADGSFLTAVSDDGRTFTGPLRHSRSDRLKDWTVEEIEPLPGLRGTGKKETDAEALVRQADGSWLVAFERRHRILRYPGGERTPEGAPTQIEIPDSIRDLPANLGIEALTVRPDGVLVAIAEATETDDGQHRLYLRRDGEWTEKRYRTAPFYAPSDAAALPNGDVLVLDRGYSLLGGIRARLVHVRSADLLSKDIVEGEVLGDLAPLIGTDNFEGLAIRRSESGELLLYLVSDDNFSPLQRTLLVQYALRIPSAID